MNESVFVTKIQKISKNLKKLKKTNKDKFKYDVKYMNKKKRIPNILKNVNLYSNMYNYYNYNVRLFSSITTLLFNQKNSDLYKLKIHTYSKLLKKNN